MRPSKIAQNYIFSQLYGSNTMPQRVLGKTGLKVSAFGLGGQALLEIENRERDAYNLINKALDLGVTYFDTATLYGPSREYLGKSLGGRRANIVIASKVKKRDYKGAKAELDESFRLLNTCYIDIIQLHSLEGDKDFKALQKDGAVQLLLEAQKAGKVRYIGITGHDNPEILVAFMEAFDFDTALIALNPAVTGMEPALAKARDRNMGIISMKIMARGILPKGIPASRLVHYAMAKSDVAIAGCSNETDVEQNVLAAQGFNPKEELVFEIPQDVKEEASFFFRPDKGGAKWPHTYQPNWPKLKY